MRLPGVARVLLLSCVGLAACSAATPDGDGAEGEVAAELGSRVGVDQLSTFEPAISLLDGYEAILDNRLVRCIEPAAERAPLVGQVMQETTIQLVKSEQELARDLGVDASLNLKTPLGSVAGTLGIVRSFKESREHLNYLIQSVQSYRVTNLAPVRLTETAQQMLANAPSSFFMMCGDRYVSDVTYQAKIVALVTFETASEERARSLKGEVGGNLDVGPVTADASIKSQLSNLAKRKDVTARMHVVAQGFDVSAEDGLLGVSGDVEAKLAQMDAVAGKLATSLRADRERDAAGYANVTLRNAIPSAVGLSRYGYATNAPPGLDASPDFRMRRERQKAAEKFLRAFAGLESSMDRAYTDEIFPLLVADAETEDQFNVIPPAAPKRFVDELRRVAVEWSARFDPDGGGVRPSDRAPVHEALEACADDIRFGTYDACRLATDPVTLPAYLAGAAALDAYGKTARTAKLRIATSSADLVSYQTATELCKSVDARLPTADEAAILAPMVGGAAGGANRAVWTSATTGCDPTTTGFPTFVNSAMTFGTRCRQTGLFADLRAATICVPETGPLPKPAQL